MLGLENNTTRLQSAVCVKYMVDTSLEIFHVSMYIMHTYSIATDVRVVADKMIMIIAPRKWMTVVRADSSLTPRQWKTSLQSNSISHRPRTKLKSALSSHTGTIWISSCYRQSTTYKTHSCPHYSPRVHCISLMGHQSRHNEGFPRLSLAPTKPGTIEQAITTVREDNWIRTCGTDWGSLMSILLFRLF